MFSETTEFASSLSWLAGAVLLVIFAYVAARTISVAYFRTKHDFERSAPKEAKKENSNHG